MSNGCPFFEWRQKNFLAKLTARTMPNEKNIEEVRNNANDDELAAFTCYLMKKERGCREFLSIKNNL